jgi:hypothetical protein
MVMASLWLSRLRINGRVTMKCLQFWIGVVCVFVSLNALASSTDTLKKKFHMLSESSSSSSSTAPAPTPTQCATAADCSDHGVCTNEQCVCDNGYITVEGYGNCGYEQKKQGTAVGLSVLHFTGAAYFYLGRVKEAVAQVVMSVVGIGSTIALLVVKSPNVNQCFGTIAALEAGAMATWTILDFFRFIVNDETVTDGNGQRLAE